MKRILSLAVILIMLFTITGCSKNSSDENLSEEKYPITLTDQAGREVTIEKEPEKIVSGYYISTSMLIALDQKEKLVGIEAKADKRPIYSLSAPELLKLPNVGSAKNFDLEGCAALEPDLVILPVKLKNSAASLEELGITTLLINPENQQLLTESIQLIGKATGSLSKAEELLAFTSEQEKHLDKTLADAEKPEVYLAGNSNMLSTAGKSMYQNDMIHMAGGHNVASEINDKDWTIVDYEQLLSWNPEYILVASDAEYTCDDVLSDPNLAECRAVKEKKVYQMPGDAEAWDSPVPSGILGSVWLSSVLHPDLCSEQETNETINGFYEKFYNFTYKK